MGPRGDQIDLESFACIAFRCVHSSNLCKERVETAGVATTDPYSPGAWPLQLVPMRVGLDSRLRRFLRVVERARVLTHAKQERTNETHKVKQSLGLGLQARHADNAPAAGTDRTAASCWFASGQWTDCLRPSAAGRCAGFSARYSTETGGRRCHAPGGRQQAAGSSRRPAGQPGAAFQTRLSTELDRTYRWN